MQNQDAKGTMTSRTHWNELPDLVLLYIYQFLSAKDVLNAGSTCKTWNQRSYDNKVWKRLLYKDFKISLKIGIAPGKRLFYEEYKRLEYYTPKVCVQTLGQNYDQVVHVSFSHDGTMFATCCKDASIKVWDSKHPCKMKKSHSMTLFSWRYTQYSQFNSSDTLLLVSGVHFGGYHSTSGEIAVFSLEGDQLLLQCRVSNKPYDIFGTWFNDNYLLSGDLFWLDDTISASVLWINKAHQETDCVKTPLINRLFRFYNRNAASVRNIMVADVDGENKKSVRPSLDSAVSKTSVMEVSLDESYSLCNSVDNDVLSSEDEVFLDCSDGNNDIEDDDITKHANKLLVFSHGSKTLIPHQIGFKKLSGVLFPKELHTLNLQECLSKRERQKLNAYRNESRNWNDFQSVADKFDVPDHVIDLHGHIIGMAFSPDHKYLYVNNRVWPSGYIISDPFSPPPIAQEIQIQVIDLTTFTLTDQHFRAHKAFSPSQECFFICLDVNDEYVASGAEDKHGYIWDRHYQTVVGRLPHKDVVNSVAFNPADSQMLVSVSDDRTIKVWRSRAFVSEVDPSTLED